MENIKVTHNDLQFDFLVRRGLPEGGDMEITIKENATQGGRPCAVITWSVQLPNGKTAIAQAVVPTRLLVMAGAAVASHHEHLTGEKLL